MNHLLQTQGGRSEILPNAFVPRLRSMRRAASRSSPRVQTRAHLVNSTHRDSRGLRDSITGSNRQVLTSLPRHSQSEGHGGRSRYSHTRDARPSQGPRNAFSVAPYCGQNRHSHPPQKYTVSPTCGRLKPGVRLVILPTLRAQNRCRRRQSMGVAEKKATPKGGLVTEETPMRAFGIRPQPVRSVRRAARGFRPPLCKLAGPDGR